MRLEWDPEKDRANRKKHGLAFEDAGHLFTSGVDYLQIFDERHSHEEHRFIAIGRIQRGVIVVSYSEPEDDILRIFSARRATKSERRRFEAHVRGWT